jgi:hypothetical protein
MAALRPRNAALIGRRSGGAAGDCVNGRVGRPAGIKGDGLGRAAVVGKARCRKRVLCCNRETAVACPEGQVVSAVGYSTMTNAAARADYQNAVGNRHRAATVVNAAAVAGAVARNGAVGHR